MLVNFFIVGTQKGGTSALDNYLRLYAGVQMANVKEIHFFDYDELDWSNPDYRRLHQSFSWKPLDGSIRGEATPIYSYWPNALRRLRDYNPDAKLIMGLRHPSFRAFSHWRMEAKRGADTLTFSEAIRERGRQRVEEAPNAVHRVFSYVERGHYAPQIEEMLSLFPRNQILFCRTDALWNRPRMILDQVASFLSVLVRPEINREYSASVLTWNSLGMHPDDRRFLDELYADDIGRTAKLTGLDLADWTDPAYEEPMKPD